MSAHRITEADVRALARRLAAPLGARYTEQDGRHLAAALPDDEQWASEVATAVGEALGEDGDTCGYDGWRYGTVLYWPDVKVGDPDDGDRLVVDPSEVDALGEALGADGPGVRARRTGRAHRPVLELGTAHPAPLARTLARLVADHPLWVDAVTDVTPTHEGVVWPRVCIDRTGPAQDGPGVRGVVPE